MMQVLAWGAIIGTILATIALIFVRPRKKNK